MIKSSVKIEGTRELVANMKATKEEIHRACKKGIDRTAIAVESDAKKRLSGQFGSSRHIVHDRLRASVHHELKNGELYNYTDKNGKSFDGSLKTEIDKLEAIAGTNVFYGPFIEFGTKYFSGDSFLGWAALKQGKLLVERIKQELDKIRT
jgi:hypothetical protein